MRLRKSKRAGAGGFSRVPSPGSRVPLFLRNDAGRKGVPLRASFQKWLEAIAELRRRKAEINVLIVGLREGRRYNREFRHKDYATNVLSFRAELPPGVRLPLLGDLVLCAPVVAREAAEQGKTSRDHYAHLTIHGALHLLGYDHENEKQAREMEALECRILADLGIADPYN